MVFGEGELLQQDGEHPIATDCFRQRDERAANKLAGGTSIGQTVKGVEAVASGCSQSEDFGSGISDADLHSHRQFMSTTNWERSFASLTDLKAETQHRQEDKEDVW